MHFYKIQFDQMTSQPEDMDFVSLNLTASMVKMHEPIDKVYKSIDLFDWELPSDQWVPKDKVRQCVKCNREFSIFTWKSHCRKCGRVFCSKCIKERYFDVDGSRILDSNLVKARERELKHKLRETKICIECDTTFGTFELSVHQMNQIKDLLNHGQNPNSNNNKVKNSAYLSPRRNIQLNSAKVSEYLDEDSQYLDYVSTIQGENDQLNTDSFSRLSEFADRHISKVVAYQLVSNDLDLQKWHSLIYGFLLKVVDQIKPSSRFLNDSSMDLNSYVKVKIIEWCDNSRSQIVNGFVFTKTVSDRNMQTNFQNPSILLLKSALEVGQSDLQTEMDQEESLIKILRVKIEQIKPQILIVEKDVNYKVMCMLRDQKITLVSSVDEKKLKKIARLTQTIVAEGVTQVDKRFVLGKCKKFEVVNHTQFAKEAGYHQASDLKEKHLMTIDGCNPALGCTILISGPFHQSQELQRVKLAIKESLVLARNIILEKSFLAMLQVDVPILPPLLPLLSLDMYEATDAVTPFLITQQILNRSILIYHEFQITMKTEAPKYTTEEETKINEKFVHSQIDKICGSPVKQIVKFYQSSSDVTLGSFLQQFSTRCSRVCQNCPLPMSQHATEIYHGDGFIKVTPSQNQNVVLNQKNRNTFDNNTYEILESRINEKQSTLFYIVCKKCNSATEKVSLPSQVYEYSCCRFYEQLLYNRLRYSFKLCPCTFDCTLNDILFCFDVDQSIKVSFQYTQTDVYEIETVSLQRFNTSQSMSTLVQEQFEQLRQNVQVVMQISKEKYRIVRSHVASIIQNAQYVNDPSYVMILAQLKQIDQLSEQINQNVAYILNDAIIEISQLTTQVFKAFFINRKVYLSLLSFQRVFLEVTKFTALLIVLARRRKDKISAELQNNIFQQDRLNLSDGLGEQKDKRSAKDLNDCRNCFIEELTKNSLMTPKYLKPQICPLSQNQNTNCNDPNLIIQTYQQICDEVQEQLYEMNYFYSEADFPRKEFSPLSRSLRPSLTNEIYQSFNVTDSPLSESARTGSFMLRRQDKSSIMVVQQKKAQQSWIEVIYSQFMTMPLGINNIFIQICEQDIGSIIAYGLSQNIYFEGLGRYNYLGMEISKSKTANIELSGADDVFDQMPDLFKLEQELLNESKFAFELRFGTYTKQTSLKVTDGKDKEIELKNTFQFKTVDDLEQQILPQVSKDYLKNTQVIENLSQLESIFNTLQEYYFNQEIYQRLKQHIAKINSDQFPLASPLSTQPSPSSRLVNTPERGSTSVKTPSSQASGSTPSSHASHGMVDEFIFVRDEMINSPHTPSPLQQTTQKLQKFGMSPNKAYQVSVKDKRQVQNFQESYIRQLTIKDNTLFDLESPTAQINAEVARGNVGLSEQLDTPLIQFEIKILFPKKFEALRRFYCGKHIEFLASIFRVKNWATTGGRTSAKFSKSHDDKYVIKEVNKDEFKMFQKFGLVYFQYMSKVLFHNYPCALAKILGAFVVKITDSNNKPQEKYILVLENLNLGITKEEEKYIVRYDLKGSELNRFINNEDQKNVVQLDSNFLLTMNGRPIVLPKKQANQLHRSLDNDSQTLAKTNIIDYSLLTIINQRQKTIRFGVIDYLQMYTIKRLMETTVKKAINFGTAPTIIEPMAYRHRFTSFAKLYLIGVNKQIQNKQQIKSREDLLKQIDDGKAELEALLNDDFQAEELNQSEEVSQIGLSLSENSLSKQKTI